MARHSIILTWVTLVMCGLHIAIGLIAYELFASQHKHHSYIAKRHPKVPGTRKNVRELKNGHTSYSTERD